MKEKISRIDGHDISRFVQKNIVFFILLTLCVLLHHKSLLPELNQFQEHHQPECHLPDYVCRRHFRDFEWL